jgi:hypothetical protein
MADSYNINFKLTDRFWQDFNKVFDIQKINGTLTPRETYKFVFLSQMSGGISSVINNDGTLKDLDSISGVEVLPQPTLTTFNLTSVIDSNGGFTISLPSAVEVSFDDSDSLYLQGILLVKHNTGDDDNEGYVLAWAKLSQPVRVQDAITIPSITEFASVGTCTG